jgi:hypothetical protein
MEDETSPPTPGWIVLLTGQDMDMSLWERSLQRPFDPWCERVPQQGLALRSRSFDQTQSADEVRERAIELIERLNGALGVEVGAEPVNYRWVGRIDDNGKVDIWVFPVTGHARLRGRGMMTPDTEVRDINGNIVPPPPPGPSAAQRWITAAAKNDDLADMLVFMGRADNWFDIYKAIELAEHLCGGRHELAKLLGDSATACKNLRETANFYRHPPTRTYLPPIPTELTEAKPLLSHIVRTVLTRRLG